ncbi:MAG: 50S ribosomal protein L22 [Candidatus Levybacteria bacterium GW2011_GWB1_35_5]|nr:MAG: 50S ribosomal protein L22 [Candidatus Levybacteria bacterium GW2011_GWB1_35_5]
MEIIAISKSVRVAPRKVRLVADAIRKLSIPDALVSLSVLNKRAALSLNKTLKSAVANAKNNNKVEVKDLTIKTIDVLEAPSFKRFHPSTRGRAHPYKRRGSHIRIVLEKKEEVQNGTKS